MSTNTDPDSLEAILTKLAREVESAVHAMYRRQAGPGTTQVRTDQFIRNARDRIASTGVAPRASVPPGAQQRFSVAMAATSESPVDGRAEWTAAEAAAITKCITGWLPMGAPANTKPDTRCVPSGRELMPLWGEREVARLAVRKVPIAGQ